VEEEEERDVCEARLRSEEDSEEIIEYVCCAREGRVRTTVPSIHKDGERKCNPKPRKDRSCLIHQTDVLSCVQNLAQPLWQQLRRFLFRKTDFECDGGGYYGDAHNGGNLMAGPVKDLAGHAANEITVSSEDENPEESRMRSEVGLDNVGGAGVLLAGLVPAAGETEDKEEDKNVDACCAGTSPGGLLEKAGRNGDGILFD
jgi:hypothetical protein